MLEETRSKPTRPEAPLDGRMAGRFTGQGVAGPFGFELAGWSKLAVATLGLAGGLALVLALSRVPGVDAIAPWPVAEVFAKGLVAHVTLAFVVWYLAMQGALSVLATGPREMSAPLWQKAGHGALWAARGGVALLIIPVFLNLGDAVQNNYVPVVSSPVFYAGLGLLAASLATVVIRLLVSVIRQRRMEPVSFAVTVAGVIYLLALVCIGLALSMPPDTDTHGLMEHIFWGGGHLWQFAVTVLFFAVLFLIARAVLGETPLAPGPFKLLCLLMLAGSAPGPLLYFLYPPGDPGLVASFTDLYWFALAGPAGLLTILFGILLIRRWPDTTGGLPEGVGAVAVVGLFAMGGAFGFFEGSSDTRTPAHYHAVLVAVTVGFMALFYVLILPMLNRPVCRPKWRTLIYVLLAGGQGLHSGGLFVAGLSGVARKTAGAAQGLDSAAKLISMSLMGVGGLIAVAGGVIFVVTAIRALFGTRADT